MLYLKVRSVAGDCASARPLIGGPPQSRGPFRESIPVPAFPDSLEHLRETRRARPPPGRPVGVARPSDDPPPRRTGDNPSSAGLRAGVTGIDRLATLTLGLPDQQSPRQRCQRIWIDHRSRH